MNFDETLLKKLEDFITGTMPENEKSTFEKEIASSDVLQDFLEIYHKMDSLDHEDKWEIASTALPEVQEAVSLFDNDAVKSFKSKIKEAHNGQPAEKKSRFGRYAFATLAAACLLVLFYINFSSEMDMSQMYADNSSWKELPSFVVKGNDSQKMEVKLEQEFKIKNYSEAASSALEIMSSKKNYDPNIYLYLGISFLELEKYDKALKTFNALINSNSIDNHKGYWYSALVYLKMEDKPKAIEFLNQVVANPNNYKYDSAKEILEDLE